MTGKTISRKAPRGRPRKTTANDAAVDLLIEGIQEATAHLNGTAVLPHREYGPALGSTIAAPDIKAIRRRLALTQIEFARRFGFAVGSLRGWEQGEPIGRSALILLRLIEREPDAVERAIAG